MQIENPETPSQQLYPRVLGNKISPNSHFTIVGLITNLDESGHKLTLEVDPTTKQTVQVKIPQTIEPAELRHLKYIQVRALSEKSNIVQMKDYVNFQDGFDLKVYNDVIKLTLQGAFKSIFGW